nr:MlaD family protein [Massilia sp. Dwa41.01b]
MPDTPPLDASNESSNEPAHVETKAMILLGVVALLIVAFVLYVMYARGVFEPTQKLVLVTENSEGVIPGMDLTFAGFPIGRVRLVDLARDGKVQIVVDVSKSDARWLRSSSVFTLERSVVGETRLRAFTGIWTTRRCPTAPSALSCAATSRPRFQDWWPRRVRC